MTKTIGEITKSGRTGVLMIDDAEVGATPTEEPTYMSKLSLFEEARAVASSGLNSRDTIALLKSITDPQEEERHFLVTLTNRVTSMTVTDGWSFYVRKDKSDAQAIAEHFAFKHRIFEANIALIIWIPTDEVTAREVSTSLQALSFLQGAAADRGFWSWFKYMWKHRK